MKRYFWIVGFCFLLFSLTGCMEEEIAKLEERNSVLRDQIHTISSKIQQVREENQQVREENQKLKEQVAYYESVYNAKPRLTGKKSGGSGIFNSVFDN